MTSRPALLLLALAWAASPGCAAVYAPGGLPEELRADVPGLEGRWRIAEPGKPATSVSVTRTGPGAYAATLADPGRGARAEGRLRTFIVSHRVIALVEGTTTDPEQGTTATPFPVVLKLAVPPGKADLWLLKPDFLKTNPTAPPFRPAAPAGQGRDDEIVVTATPRQLADFLAAVADDPRAWVPMTDGAISITREPGAAGSVDWGARFQGWVPQKPPATQAPAPSKRGWLWEWKWTVAGVLVFGFWLFGHLAKRFTSPGPHAGTAAEADTRRAWVDLVARLLVLAVRTTRTDQALRGPERALIAAVAAAEARRPDAPGGPAPMSKGDVERLIRGYEGDCPGVVELCGFLADPANAALQTRLLKRVWQAAVCDGLASDAEAEFVRSFAAETGVSEAEFVSVSLRYHRPRPPEAALDEARALLEVSRWATAEDVKRAYKKKAREYHPDSHAGAAETLKKLAAERFSRVGEAKQTLLSALGARGRAARRAGAVGRARPGRGPPGTGPLLRLRGGPAGRGRRGGASGPLPEVPRAALPRAGLRRGLGPASGGADGRGGVTVPAAEG